MARSKAMLGDACRDVRAAWMFDRIVMSGSLVLRDPDETRSGEIAAHRLLSSDDGDAQGLLVPHAARTTAACKGRRIVRCARRNTPSGLFRPTANKKAGHVCDRPENLQ